MTDLSSLMRQVSPRRASAQDAAVRPADEHLSNAYTTSAGKTVSMADMNPYHRENAIKKAQREGRADLVAALEASRPKE